VRHPRGQQKSWPKPSETLKYLQHTGRVTAITFRGRFGGKTTRVSLSSGKGNRTPAPGAWGGSETKKMGGYLKGLDDDLRGTTNYQQRKKNWTLLWVPAGKQESTKRGKIQVEGTGRGHIFRGGHPKWENTSYVEPYGQPPLRNILLPALTGVPRKRNPLQSLGIRESHSGGWGFLFKRLKKACHFRVVQGAIRFRKTISE